MAFISDPYPYFLELGPAPDPQPWCKLQSNQSKSRGSDFYWFAYGNIRGSKDTKKNCVLHVFGHLILDIYMNEESFTGNDV